MIYLCSFTHCKGRNSNPQEYRSDCNHTLAFHRNNASMLYCQLQFFPNPHVFGIRNRDAPLELHQELYHQKIRVCVLSYCTL